MNFSAFDLKNQKIIQKLKTGSFYKVDGFKVPEKYRIKDLESGGVAGTNFGFFSIPSDDKDFINRRQLLCLASDGTCPKGSDLDVIPHRILIKTFDFGNSGWCHVSIRAVINLNGTLKSKTPSWNEMCQIKDLFWRSDQVVMQLHPAKENYVNVHENVLHLWSVNEEFGKLHIPTPPKVMV